MNQDQFILISLLAIFFLTVLSFVYFFPAILAWILSKRAGWTLSWKEAMILKKNSCYYLDFFKKSKQLRDLEDVDVAKMAMHYHAGGNFANVVNGIKQARNRKLKYDLQTLFTIDLSKHDIASSLKNIKDGEEVTFVKAVLNDLK